tara:strand:+ start:72 stop:830 length:759 start_codon:yes stop_codon:yes gene_type:complete
MPLPPRFAKQKPLRSAKYSELSREPLYMLVFLLPLIIFYEIALYSSNAHIHIKAREHLVRFFELFDMPFTQGLWLGGIAIITTLFIWHLFTGDRWKIQLHIIGGMAAEAIAFTVPLVVFGAVLGGYVAATTNSQIGSLDAFDKIAVSVGAGLYEEFLFRMILIAGIHTIVCNVFKQSEVVGLGIGIFVSAILFALYHDLPNAGTLSPIVLFFFFGAGVYLGFLYVIRGFGIAAATHAVYDVIATILLVSEAQ